MPLNKKPNQTKPNQTEGGLAEARSHSVSNLFFTLKSRWRYRYLPRVGFMCLCLPLDRTWYKIDDPKVGLMWGLREGEVGYEPRLERCLTMLVIGSLSAMWAWWVLQDMDSNVSLGTDAWLCYILTFGPSKMPFKVMHRKEVTHSNGSYERKSRGRKLADEMGRAKKFPWYTTEWCTWREWPPNCMTVISAWWRLNIRFQRSSGRRTIT